MINDYVHDMYAVNTGFILQIERLTRLSAFHAWYDGDLTSLLSRVGNVTNGLSLFLQAEANKLGIFKGLSTVYQHSVFGQKPQVQVEGELLQGLVDASYQYFLRQAKFAIDYWSYGDVFAMATELGRYIPIPGENLLFITERSDPTKVIGYNVLWFYYEGPQAHLYHRIPNRLRVVRYSEELHINQVDDYVATPYSVGQQISSRPGRLTSLEVVGNSESYYADISDHVLRLTVLNTLANQAVHRFLDPHLAVNAQIANEVGHDYQNRLRNGTGFVFTSSGESVDLQYLQATLDPELLLEQKTYHSRQISILSGVSPQISGLDVGPNESGISRTRVLYQHQQTVTDTRQSLAKAVPKLIQGATGITAPVECTWVVDPLEDKTEKIEQLIKLREANIISPQFVQNSLGIIDPDWQEISPDDNAEPADPASNPGTATGNDARRAAVPVRAGA